MESRPGINRTVGCGPAASGARSTPTRLLPSKGITTRRPGGSQVRQRVGEARDRLPVGRAHLVQVLDEHELGEVVVHRGPGQVLPGREPPVLGERGPAELLVLRGHRAPGAAPVGPPLDGGRHPLEVRDGHAVGGEPRPPVGDRRRNLVVHRAPRRADGCAANIANDCSLPSLLSNRRKEGRILQTSADRIGLTSPPRARSHRPDRRPRSARLQPVRLLSVARRLGGLGDQGLEVAESPVAVVTGAVPLPALRRARHRPDQSRQRHRLPFVPGNPLGQVLDARIVGAVDRALGSGPLRAARRELSRAAARQRARGRRGDVGLRSCALRAGRLARGLP